ncbi:MAG: hypothetical protein HY349_03875 [Nitrospirae bacterium]|nr:hypothetical protein [Nitrospirota bacterium]
MNTMAKYNATKYHTTRMLLIAQKTCDRATANPEESISGILLSVFAFECFLNEFEDVAQSKILPSDPKRLQILSDFLTSLERANAKIQLKIQAIYSILAHRRIDFGSYPFQDLSMLIAIRNALVHRKPEKFNWDPANPDNESKPHKFVAFLADKKVINRPSQTQPEVWDTDVLCPEVAAWALRVVKSAIKKILGEIPKSRVKFVMKFLLHQIVKQKRR